MTQYQFDELVLKNAQSYDVTQNPYQNIFQTIGSGITSTYNVNSSYTNSNTYIDNIIEQSGGIIKYFYNTPLQNSGELDELYK
jgi:hypothetical protein